MVGTLRWVRAFNAAHPDDPVRFVGVEYYYTGRPAYDAVRRYVAASAPRLLPALRADLRVIYPDLPQPGGLRRAVRRGTAQGQVHPPRPPLRGLVSRVPHRPGDPAYALVRQHARQIVPFDEHYALSLDAQDDYRERHAARNLRWWQQRTHNRVVYWAALPHTVAARRLRIALPGVPDFRYRATGSYLREWYGARYVSVGFTFDHGAVGLRPVEVSEQPPPDPGWLEAPLGRVDRAPSWSTSTTPHPGRPPLAAHPADHPRTALGPRVDGHGWAAGPVVRRAGARAASDPATTGLSLPTSAQAGEETKEN